MASAFTRPYGSRSAPNWADFLAQVEVWIPTQLTGVYAIMDNQQAHRATNVLWHRDARHLKPDVRAELRHQLRSIGNLDLADYRRTFNLGVGMVLVVAKRNLSKARALLNGRFHVDFADIRALAPEVLRHRLVLNYRSRADKVSADDLIARVIDALFHLPVTWIDRKAVAALDAEDAGRIINTVQRVEVVASTPMPVVPVTRIPSICFSGTEA